MTQDRELLLKDIYARIPYGVKGCCEDETFHTTPLHWYAEHTLEYSVNYMVMKFGWRPYLFPLSSMTEEERITIGNQFAYGQPHKAIDILHQKHIDYRGLISMGLAVDATGLNIY